MAMLITEELLKNLGFTQQNPLTIWDLYYGGERYFRFERLGDDWYFCFRKHRRVLAKDLLSMMYTVAFMAHADGVEETQNKLYDALGLNRLVEMTVDRLREDDD